MECHIGRSMSNRDLDFDDITRPSLRTCLYNVQVHGTDATAEQLHGCNCAICKFMDLDDILGQV